jgi:hypothetical protein
MVHVPSDNVSTAFARLVDADVFMVIAATVVPKLWCRH